MDRTQRSYAPRLEVEDERTVLMVPHAGGCLAVELPLGALDDLGAVLTSMADGSEGGTVSLDLDTWVGVGCHAGRVQVQLSTLWASVIVDLDAMQFAALALEVAKARTLVGAL